MQLWAVASLSQQILLSRRHCLQLSPLVAAIVRCRHSQVSRRASSMNFIAKNESQKCSTPCVHASMRYRHLSSTTGPCLRMLAMAFLQARHLCRWRRIHTCMGHRRRHRRSCRTLMSMHVTGMQIMHTTMTVTVTNDMSETRRTIMYQQRHRLRTDRDVMRASRVAGTCRRVQRFRPATLGTIPCRHNITNWSRTMMKVWCLFAHTCEAITGRHQGVLCWVRCGQCRFLPRRIAHWPRARHRLC